MAKNFKLNIKNKQIANAVNLSGLKDKLAKKKSKEEPKPDLPPEEETPRIKARSKSAFAEAEQEAKKKKEAAAAKPKVDKPSKTAADVAADVAAEPVKTVKEPVKPKKEKLGPTGRHIKDLLPAKPKVVPKTGPADSGTARPKPKEGHKKPAKAPAGKFKDFRDFKAHQSQSRFDSRDRQGLRAGEEPRLRYRKKRAQRSAGYEDTTVRPNELTIRIPITLKDLADKMKRKASELIAVLIKQGSLLTINDTVDDEITIGVIGNDLACAISIDTSEEERIKITGKTISEEISEAEAGDLTIRSPVIAFMGHVDHGKTTLIDMIRKSNIASGEAGAITQHIGAFRCTTAVGDITILDTPGHEAFSAMRERGASVTDVIILVVAGDEGIKQQTIEAIEHAKNANVTLVVAINKSDKPGFNPENIYRQLADQELLPESWGGQTITVNCSGQTGEGIKELLEMVALQAEVLELNANPKSRARGTILESQMHKGLGGVSTMIVQNGTLRKGDAIVCDALWGRIKTMRNEFGKELEEAGPSTPVEISGLSEIPEAGEEFIVVDSEKEAKEIATARVQQAKQTALLKKRKGLDTLLGGPQDKKTCRLIICADVQGSLEALRTALEKIKSDKVDLDIVSTAVGEVSESIIELAAASKAKVLGFHTRLESHAESLIKEFKVDVVMHDIIYHAIDATKKMMKNELDKLAKENDMGEAEVRAIFKASHLGNIAGCMVTGGYMNRNHRMRVIRAGKTVWTGPIASLKRVKEDVQEVKKGVECGVVLQGFDSFEEGDRLESFEIVYVEQEI